MWQNDSCYVIAQSPSTNEVLMNEMPKLVLQFVCMLLCENDDRHQMAICNAIILTARLVARIY